MTASDHSKPDNEKKKQPADKSPIPSRPEDTDASGDARNGTGEDNHREK